MSDEVSLEQEHKRWKYKIEAQKIKNAKLSKLKEKDQKKTRESGWRELLLSMDNGAGRRYKAQQRRVNA